MRGLLIAVVVVLAALGGWWAYEQLDGPAPAVVSGGSNTPAATVETSSDPYAPAPAAQESAPTAAPTVAQGEPAPGTNPEGTTGAASQPLETTPPDAVVRAEDADVAPYEPLEVQPFDVVLGNPSAPVTIIEYASLTCPHCAAFHNETLSRIKENYIATGKAKLVVREFPLDRVALYGAILARCVDPQRFHPVVETMFKTQDNWARAANPSAALNNIARLAGLTQEQIDTCASNQKIAEFVANNRLMGQQLGIEATPTFFINGEKVSGARSFEEFAAIIDRLAP